MPKQLVYRYNGPMSSCMQTHTWVPLRRLAHSAWVTRIKVQNLHGHAPARTIYTYINKYIHIYIYIYSKTDWNHTSMHALANKHSHAHYSMRRELLDEHTSNMHLCHADYSHALKLSILLACTYMMHITQMCKKPINEHTSNMHLYHHSHNAHHQMRRKPLNERNELHMRRHTHTNRGQGWCQAFWVRSQGPMFLSARLSKWEFPVFERLHDWRRKVINLSESESESHEYIYIYVLCVCSPVWVGLRDCKRKVTKRSESECESQ